MKKEAKDLLLQQLTKEEIVVLFHQMRTLNAPNSEIPDLLGHNAIVTYLRKRMEVNSFYRYVVFSLGIKHRANILSGEALSKDVLAQIPEIKKELEVLKNTGVIPRRNIRAFNRHIGDALVTEHALEQFSDRNRLNGNVELVVSLFKELFLNAAPTDISTLHRVERIINNNFERAIYLLNADANLRFVVRERKPHIVLTVERPH